MLTHAVCQPMSKARSLQTAMARSAMRPTSSFLPGAGHRQQIRTFRFGMWSSFLDTEFHKEIRHRHRMLKHKYVEALNKQLSWEQRSFDGHPRAVIKHMLRRYWNPAQLRYGSRFVSYNESDGRHRQTRATPGSEDGRMKANWTSNQSAPWMSSYGASNPFRPYSDTWKSRLDEINNWVSKAAGQAEYTSSATKPNGAQPIPNNKNDRDADVSFVEDYTIDPITNRKVFKRTSEPIDDATSVPSDSFKAYRAQFTAFGPPKDEGRSGFVHSNGPPPPSELKEYGRINIEEENGSSVPEEGSESPRHPIIQSEEYALNHLPPEEPDEQYDDFHRYQTYQQAELDEQTPEPTQKYEDLHNYKTYGASESEAASQETPQDIADLNEYKPYMHNESADREGKPLSYDDLGDYGPFKYQEDKVKDDPSPKYDDLDDYKHYNEDKIQSSDEAAPQYEDLDKYKLADFQDSPAEEQPFQQYGDLEQYRTFKQELDEKNTLEHDTVAEALKEFDAKEQAEDAAETNIADRLEKLDLGDGFSTNTFTLPPSSSTQSHHSSTTNIESRQHLEQSMSSHIEASDAADREAIESIRESRSKGQGDGSSQHKLTGNYVRDFPEEFSGSWAFQGNTEAQGDRAAHIQAAEKHYADRLSNPKDFETIEISLDGQQAESKLEPALDRTETRYSKTTLNHHSETEAEFDPYSKEPQGLETSYTNERDEIQAKPTFAKSYNPEPTEVDREPALMEDDNTRSVFQFESTYHRDPEIDGKPPILSFESNPKTDPSRTTEPIVYKILAYDPTTQKINLAETTSIVPDQTSPLSPAEVLLRLSNPTKFLPHFAPLQAEGFEIVSGSGDVLVFRQVRSSKMLDKEATMAINPIDMMGKPMALPNAAAFVSPTGFVNYDVPQVEVEMPTAPPFRSNIDVRREEPVFSGPKSPDPEEIRKAQKKGLGKRALVGGAWVASISYALGVVSEYFITGGSDGRGPTGL
ncbi:hypothetical protein M426DRAFT_9598 [Hypoxylon sp. CI-4A]|nr:hypothetical protein M426DRAFT_9598 [Hypoxylon sp. CI-4A]